MVVRLGGRPQRGGRFQVLCLVSEDRVDCGRVGAVTEKLITSVDGNVGVAVAAGRGVDSCARHSPG